MEAWRVNLSLNEVELAAKKAARGAGYPWGLAEEAAKATRWLCENGLDGCAILLSMLKMNDGIGNFGRVAEIDQGIWRGVTGKLCPIAAGASLSDCASCLNAINIHMENVAQPALLIPFAAIASNRIGADLMIVWSRSTAVTDGAELEFSGSLDHFAIRATVTESGMTGRPIARQTRASPEFDIWESLNSFAERTYAPATDESRFRGAGSGDSDND